MHHITRLKLALLFTVCLSATVGAANPAPKQSEYKRSDTNFYWKGDVLKVDPNAVIIPQGKYTQKADSYFIDTKGKAPHDIYIQVENDWVEPITPPTMPTSLGVAPDAMEVREPQGDVTVALPSAPANFVPVQNNMAIPNGAVVKTGANGTAAVLMGGVNSIRLIPNSSAAVDQTVAPGMRTTVVNLTTGAAFSKVGKRIGEKQDYQVKTPFGVAAARGTDFVTVAMPARTDVWIAQGTVQMDQPDGKVVGTVSSEGTGALKIIRFPSMPDAHAAMMASAQTMTAAMNFIPTVNVYVKALNDKMAQGIKLTPTERDYLNRIKKVPCLIKLTLVEPPAPPPVPKLAPAAVIAPLPAPAPAAPAPEAATAPAKPATPPLKVQIEVAADGTVKLNDVPVETDAALAASLDGIAKNNPAQSVVLVAGDKVPRAQVDHVMSICKAAKLTHVKRVNTAPKETAATSSSAAAPAATAAPVAAPAPAAPAKPAVKPATPPPVLAPVDLNLRPDAKVDFKGETLTLEELKPKLQEIGKTTPEQPFVINGQEKVKPAEMKKITAMFHAAKLNKVIVASAAPLPKPAVAAAPAPAPAPTPAAPPAPLDVAVRADGKVDFQGGTLTLDELKPKLEALAKSTPNQPLVVKRKEKLEKGQMKKVVDLCNASKLKVTIDKTPPPAAPATPSTPAPATVSAPLPDSTPAPPPPAPPPKPLPPAMLLPINLDLRPGGKVDMQGQTYALNDLKIKLEEMGLTTPKQPLVVVPDAKVTRTEVKNLVALCMKSKLTDVTIAKAVPPTSPAVAHGAKPASLPASSSEAKTSTSVASASVAPAATVAAEPSHPAKRRASSSAPAPISTGPEYTVP